MSFRLLQQLVIGGRTALGLMAMRRSDVLLSSFPRSGSTWVRFLLANYLVNQEAEEIDFARLNSLMPELGATNLLAGWPFSPFPRVIKTHLSFSRLFGRNRAVGLMRDPRDVMVSYYRFLVDRDAPVFCGEFGEFLRDRSHGLESWFHHTATWLNNWDFLLRYEKIRVDPFKEFHRFLSWLGFEAEAERLERAVEQSSIDSIASLSKCRPPNRPRLDSRFEFVRDGRVGQWEEVFEVQDLDYFRRVQERFSLPEFAVRA